MADYYPLVARAVAGLERNTGEARRALYERARTALVTQLRGVNPPLEESHITRERLALEEAIRKVEGEAARRPRAAPAAPAPQQNTPQPAAPQPAAPPPPAAPQARQPMPAPPPPPSAATPHTAAPPPRAPMPQAQPLEHPSPPPLRVPVPEEIPRRRGVDLDHAAAPPLAPQAQPQSPQTPRRQPPQPPRDPLAGLPTAYDFDQHQPVLDPETLRPPQDYHPGYAEPPAHAEPPEEDLPPPRRLPIALGGLIKVALSVAIVFALGGLAWWQRDTIRGVYQAFRGSPAAVSRDTAPSPSSASRPKINDRIGQSAQPQSGPVAPAVAQRVVLYEEEANDPQGKRYLGSVIWRTETISPGPGKPPELAVRADVEIPERRLNMTFSLRQNTDQTLPASHTVEIMFNLPADFPAGGISNVPGILMKQAEQTRGTPLAGLAVKVTSGFFLIGLSAVEADRQRNIELLKERAWFDIPIVYTNNRRAILALEKGTPGERAFAEAFATWKQ
jgi:hypothetical protein